MSQLIEALNTAQKRSSKPQRALQAKTTLWIILWSSIVFVFITNELLLIADYPLYHAYRLLIVADRYKLIPHAIFGTAALLIGPLQFSTRFRQQHLQLHRVLGRVYVVSVFCAAIMALTITWGRTLMPATCIQAGTWVLCTALAFITARNRQIARHREWMMRSYAITFTFISTRILSIWPAYWNLSDQANVIVIIGIVLGSLLAVDIGLSWTELIKKNR